LYVDEHLQLREHTLVNFCQEDVLCLKNKENIN
jgi:hypothetical protein